MSAQGLFTASSAARVSRACVFCHGRSGNERMSYSEQTSKLNQLIAGKNGAWDGINAESVARMRLQNRFTTGLDIARYTAAILRKDMAAYDADPANYTQSLGCWHGFIAQQQMIAIKKHFGTTHG